MIEFTTEHLKRLEEFEVNSYVEEIAKELELLDLDIDYPKSRAEFLYFSHNVYMASKKYDLSSKKDVHAFMVANYILGSEFKETQWLMEILEDSSNENWEKREALLCASYEKLDLMGVE